MPYLEAQYCHWLSQPTTIFWNIKFIHPGKNDIWSLSLQYDRLTVWSRDWHAMDCQSYFLPPLTSQALENGLIFFSVTDNALQIYLVTIEWCKQKRNSRCRTVRTAENVSCLKLTTTTRDRDQKLQFGDVIPCGTRTIYTHVNGKVFSGDTALRCGFNHSLQCLCVPAKSPSERILQFGIW